MYRTIKRYNETGNVKDRPRSGRPKTATTKEIVNKVRDRIKQNPRLSATQLAKDMNVSQESMQRILKNNLGLKSHKQQKFQVLKPKQEKVRMLIGKLQ